MKNKTLIINKLIKLVQSKMNYCTIGQELAIKKEIGDFSC